MSSWTIRSGSTSLPWPGRRATTSGIDRALSLEALVWRLFHEEQEVRVIQGKALARGVPVQHRSLPVDPGAFPRGRTRRDA